MTFIHRIAYPLALLSLLTAFSDSLWAKCTDPSHAPRFTDGRKGDMICDRVAGASKESLMPAGTGYYVRLLLIPGSAAATSAGIHTD